MRIADLNHRRAPILSLRDSVESAFRGFRAPFSERRALLIIVDTLLLVLAMMVAGNGWQATAGDLHIANQMLGRWYWPPIVVGSWWLIAWFNDLYDIPSSYSKLLNVIRVAFVGTLGGTLYSLSSLLVGQRVSIQFFYFVAIAVVLIGLWRLAYAALSNLLPFQHRILILGCGERGRTIGEVVGRLARLNYRLLGYVDDGRGTPNPVLGLRHLGTVADVTDIALQLGVHEIVVASERAVDEELLHKLIACQANGVTVSWMADLYGKLCRRIPVQHIDPGWALYALQDRALFNRLQLSVKRVLDLLLAVLGLPVLALLGLPIALLIRLDSRGPVFYRQTRCGRAGKLFNILKFRFMTVDAEKDGRARWATKDDQRITRVGRFLRKLRLDELPQLLNVLRGEMSFVGPRPERPEFVAELDEQIPFYRARLTIKPGLTGWAQIHYEYGNSVADALSKLQFDFYYLRNWSLLLDAYILFKTAAVVLKFKGT